MSRLRPRRLQAPANRQTIIARRKHRRKRNRRRGNIISPTITPRRGPGTGHVSMQRSKRAIARRRKKYSEKVTTRKLVVPDSPWRFIAYFFTEDANHPRASLGPQHEAIREFIRNSFSGKYKLVQITSNMYRKTVKLVNYVKMEDEGDLFSLMLCHREVVRKLFEIDNTEARKRASVSY
jgi:hypothetical protein